MSSEKFMKSLPFVSDAKLRLSYGLTGNNRVGDFAYLPTLDLRAVNTYVFDNVAPTKGGIVITNLGNSDLKWETTEQTDLGYDLSLFKNRVEFTVDWYRKTTKDLLLAANLPYYTGFTSSTINVGKVQNQGLEFSLNTVNLKSKGFTWESNFNISFNDSKVLGLNANEQQMINTVTWETSYNSSPLYITKVGEPVGQFYGYVWDGNYQYSDFDQPSPGVYTLKNTVTTNGNPRANIKPGDIKYKDLNNDGVVNTYDQTVIGRGLPIHTGGFMNNFSYKGFNLGVFFQWSYGNDIYNANRLIFEGTSRLSLNQYATYNDRWTPENQNNTQFRVGGQGPAGMNSSRVIEDGSFLRLKTLSLDYSIPARLIKPLHIKNLGLSASAQNLYTWTKYSGMDPEVSSKHSALTPGFDYSSYPHARTIVFGLKATL